MSKRLRFLGLLSNVGDSLVGVHLMPELRVEKWPTRKLLRFLNAIRWVPDIDVAYFLAEHYYCLDVSGDHGYVIAGDLPLPQSTQDQDRWKVERQAQEEMISRLEQRVKLMRLFEDGAIEMPAWFFYRFNNRVPEPDFSSWHSSVVKYRPYRVFGSVDELNAFLKKWEIPLPFPYLQLAFESFDESYDAHNSKTEFLTLMIAVEILFNVGPQELRYRVSRGMAVVLGETRREAEKIFSRMKKLYDKRSKLVHTGRSEITENDVWWLREYVRRAIVVLGELGIPKEELAPKLDEAGFGQRARYLGYSSRSRSQCGACCCSMLTSISCPAAEQGYCSVRAALGLFAFDAGQFFSRRSGQPRSSHTCCTECNRHIPPARSEKQRVQKNADPQLNAILESLRQGKHNVFIDGKALSPSETAQQIAAHGKEFINEFQGVVEDAIREATHRRETWKNPLTSPAAVGFPSEYWVHFEINVDTSVPHVDYPNWVRCMEKSCPENG